MGERQAAIGASMAFLLIGVADARCTASDAIPGRPLSRSAQGVSFHVRVRQSRDAFLVSQAIRGAHRRLSDPGCQNVCTAWFREAFVTNPSKVEAVTIHEALHTLGLGENPPSSREITARVVERCFR
jgi:hypothetical protein